MSRAATDTFTERRRALIGWGVSFAGWTVVALVTTQLQYFARTQVGDQPDLGRMLAGALASCWVWAVFTPAFYALGLRFRIDRATWRWTVPIHLGAAAVATLVDVVMMRELIPIFDPAAMGPRVAIHVAFARSFFLYSVCYFIIVALAHVRYYAALSHERDVKAAQLEGQLASARLAVLQGQLRPHFLFNTLNMIAEQVHTDPTGADAMLTRLGALLRSSFVDADREEVPLWSELQLLDAYLDIMRARFRGRLTFETDVDPAARDALVPRFVLQPLVENAIKHGVEPMEDGGRIVISAQVAAAVLELEVRDNGDGLRSEVREGTGLGNTRERLEQLYGATEDRLSLRPADGGGVVVTLRIPFRAGDPAPSLVAVTPAQDPTPRPRTARRRAS